MEERVPQIVQLKLTLLICETTYKLIGVFGITITKISEIIVITISPTLFEIVSHVVCLGTFYGRILTKFRMKDWSNFSVKVKGENSRGR